MILQYEPSYNEEERLAINNYMASGGWLTEGKETLNFESEICKFLNVKHASCVNNGTISLSLALMALGLKAGDKVVVPDITMIASANAGKLIGIEPVFVDVMPDTLCLNLEATLNKILKDDKIKAVIYVSLNGRSHSLDQLIEFREALHDNGVFLIEDAAQSFGSQVLKESVSLTNTSFQSIGTIGDIGSFSFSPHKLITTGQGGCLVTNSIDIYERIEKLKDFGRLAGGTDIHTDFGINSKFTDLQAVIGLAQLKKIEARKSFKRWLYDEYKQQLQDIEEILFLDFNDGNIPWFVDIYVKNRDELIGYLAENNIQTRKLYPALHTQKIYSYLENTVPFYQTIVDTEVASKYSAMGLWLPSSLSLNKETVLHICELIKAYYVARR